MADLSLSGPPNTAEKQSLAPRREIIAWASYDFANSGYTTVVLTAIFNAYFVGVVAGGIGPYSKGEATFLWTFTLAVTNFLVLFSAPVIGAIADHRACKKRFLVVTTIGCVGFTSLLASIGPGDVLLAMVLLVGSNYMFAVGESLISAFLPELAPQKDMGRISGYGWALGYIGGLLVLGLCLAYVTWAESKGHGAEHYVAVTMLITAAAFAVAALPTFLFLRERAIPTPRPRGRGYIIIGFSRVKHTLSHARHYTDLFRFLFTLTIFYSGVHTVIVLAAVYAQEVMGFATQETIFLILIVNITAAVGALIFGSVQDRLGSVRTLAITLVLWIMALVIAYRSQDRLEFWLAANLIGIALGSSQSAGRALIGQFSPPKRSGEFFGLWSLAGRLAAIMGPLAYGSVVYLTQGDQRTAILSTTAFFIAGLLLLLTVNERRGKQAAHTKVTIP